jgi:Icc-related predicted phosphoesterase
LLPTTARFVDAEVLEIEGWKVGVVGGGVPRLGTEGEVSAGVMAEKLKTLGPIDVLCTHVPAAIEPLARDVIGRGFKGSQEILEFVDRNEPQFHFFGDIHQPRAVSWRRGATLCRNVGYFRATGRPFRFPAKIQPHDAVTSEQGTQ